MSTRTPALLLATDYHPMVGGIARLLTNLVAETADIVEWRVLALGQSADGETPGVFRASSRLTIWSEIPGHARWLRSTAGRLVVCGHVNLLGHALMAGRLAGAPIATLAYGMELVPRRLRNRMMLRALRTSGRVVTISGHSAQAVRRLGVAPDRIRVVNPTGARPQMGAIEVKARAPGAGLRLVTVTRLVEGYKNLELLFRAVSVLADSGTVCRLTVIGDGPRRPALEQKARLLGVGRLVEFAGRVQDSEMERLLCESHLGLFPSRDSLAEGGFEGFGLVVHELASAGLPVLVGKAAGAVDAADPAWAILLDPDDLRSWVRAVENIAADEPGRLRMARSALAWAQTVDHRATARRFLEAMRL